MKQSIQKKTSLVVETLPLMTNITLEEITPEAKAESPLLPERSIEITGTVARGLNLVNVTFHQTPTLPVRFGAKAFRAFLRLAAEVKLRGTDTIVTALDLQREGIVPWGTVDGTMMEVFESIATSVGGDAAQFILGVLAYDSEDREHPWTRLIWDTYIELLFGIEHRQPIPLSSIWQRILGTDHPSSDLAFLRGNGWRTDFAYLHGYTMISKESQNATDARFDTGYDLGCNPSALRYDRAALLRHDDELVRRIAAILPA